mgnify:CR=1 FL=1
MDRIRADREADRKMAALLAEVEQAEKEEAPEKGLARLRTDIRLLLCTALYRAVLKATSTTPSAYTARPSSSHRGRSLYGFAVTWYIATCDSSWATAILPHSRFDGCSPMAMVLNCE